MQRIPILLLQWLTDPGDGQEAAMAFAEFAAKFEVSHIDIGAVNGGKSEVRHALLEWAKNNVDCQCVYIGCHGFSDRLGPSDSFPTDEVGITYRELWQWLQEAHKLHRKACRTHRIRQCEMAIGQRLEAWEGRMDVWFGACQSTAAKDCWSDLSEQTKPWPVQSIIGFEDKPKPAQVSAFLRMLMSHQLFYPIVWSDQSWQLLMEELPDNLPAIFELDETEEPARWVRPYGILSS